MKYDCIIIGGGASGLMLAAKLNMKGHRGLLLESTGKFGSKLLMSGGGHCNITHAGAIKDFIPAYGEAGRSLRKCLYRHNNLELIEWLEAGGLRTVTNEEARVFPAGMRSVEVLNFLVSHALDNGWDIRTASKVIGISRSDDEWLLQVEAPGAKARGKDASGDEALATGNEALATGSLVIASGGITYPETGSDGSIFDILKHGSRRVAGEDCSVVVCSKVGRSEANCTVDISSFGIELTELRPALAPIIVEDYPYAELAGISLSDVSIAVQDCENGTVCGKQLKMSGDILFTHDGFSGPAILNISGYAKPGCRLTLNYSGGRAVCAESVKDCLESLPKRMRKLLENRARGTSGEIKTSRLEALLERDEFTVSAVSERGMVTRGGIALKQIDLATMELKAAGVTEIAGETETTGETETSARCRLAGLYAIGEAIDADGISGGYNLQLCYSTACAAADAIREQLE